MLTALYNASLAGITDGAAKTRGIAVGNAAAAAMIAARTADGRFGTPGFLHRHNAGCLAAVLPTFGNDPNAWVKDVKPFLIKGASQFRSDGPYDLTSPKYAREFNEVKTVGSASAPLTDRSPVQTNAALYWAENLPRTWNRIFNLLSAWRACRSSTTHACSPSSISRLRERCSAVWDEKGHHCSAADHGDP